MSTSTSVAPTRSMPSLFGHWFPRPTATTSEISHAPGLGRRLIHHHDHARQFHANLFPRLATIPATVVTFTLTEASFVRLEITSNNGGPDAGFNEAAFGIADCPRAIVTADGGNRDRVRPGLPAPQTESVLTARQCLVGGPGVPSDQGAGPPS